MVGLPALILLLAAMLRPMSLIDAVRAGRWEEARRLAEQDIGVDERDNMLMTPLTWALMVGRSDLATTLLSAEADPGRHTTTSPRTWRVSGPVRSR